MQSSIVSKVTKLLTHISEASTPMTFSDLVLTSGFNKSTTHRVLSICIEERLVQFDPDQKTYLLGPKVFNLVRGAFAGYDIQTVALGEMTRLHRLYDANITPGVPNGMDVVYLRVIESRSAYGSSQRPGMRECVHCSASGKALLAFLPEQLAASKLSGYEFKRYTDRTILDAQAFNAALAKVRDAGFATNDREEYEHFLGISAPIFNYMGDPIAALNIWSVHPHHEMHEMITWAPELMASAAAVTKLIGGVAP